MSHPAFCGISDPHLGELAAELGARWEARCESARHERRGGVRLREAGDGPKYGLVFVDRLPATLVHLRTGLTYEALGVIYEVGSSTISRALRDASAARRARVRRPGPAWGAAAHARGRIRLRRS
ncbi:transposase family protein [Streptomyces mirabilis]|uniref:transposase family protein n=1 Tax=Streptomyces mirabilis TaxID=68239 RepID=UPI0036C44DED